MKRKPQLRKVRALLPYKEEIPIYRYPQGRRSVVDIFKRFERGKPKRFVERRETVPHENPISRFHVPNILNILHSALPEVFPAAIEVRSLRFEKERQTMRGIEFEKIIPVMGSVNIVPVKSIKGVRNSRLGEYIANLRSAGFDFDNTLGDIKFVEKDGKIFPVFIEVYGLNFHKLTEFINQLSGDELKKLKPVWKEIIRKKRAYIADLINGLKDENHWVRSDNAETLGETRDKRAIFALERSLVRDEDPNVRIEALRGLCKTYDPSVIPFLKKAYDREHHNDFVKRYIQETIDFIKATAE